MYNTVSVYVLLISRFSIDLAETSADVKRAAVGPKTLASFPATSG